MSDDIVPTPMSAIPEIVAAARKTFDSGVTRPLAWRMKQLKAIRRLVEENADAIRVALQADLRRPDLECEIAEVATVVAEAQDAIDHLYTWAKPEAVDTPLALLPGSSYVQREPLGVVLIIAPWNFPIQLTLNPAVAALAAGNTVVLKPSEVAPASARLMQELIPRYLDNDAVKIVQGAVAETTALLAERFDHIVYTGNGAVAKFVMAAAAKNLTPVTLELGGKSPAIVDKTADLKLSAKRIISGKCLNNGQVCIAPDYVLVERSIQDKLIETLKSTLIDFYGKDPKASPDLGRIVNERHFDRVLNLIKTGGGVVEAGGAATADRADKFIPPTIIRDPKPDSLLMADEIFGPVLPIVGVGSVDEAIAYINARPKPLALYVFSSSGATKQRVLSQTTSGGAVVNDTIMHNANPSLPFGGVGPSGLGAYHGKFGFEALSHRKAVFYQSTWLDPRALMYPPYSPFKQGVLSFVLTKLPTLPFSVPVKDIAILGLSAAVAVLTAKVMGKI